MHELPEGHTLVRLRGPQGKSRRERGQWARWGDVVISMDPTVTTGSDLHVMAAEAWTQEMFLRAGIFEWQTDLKLTYKDKGQPNHKVRIRWQDSKMLSSLGVQEPQGQQMVIHVKCRGRYNLGGDLVFPYCDLA